MDNTNKVIQQFLKIIADDYAGNNIGMRIFAQSMELSHQIRTFENTYAQLDQRLPDGTLCNSIITQYIGKADPSVHTLNELLNKYPEVDEMIKYADHIADTFERLLDRLSKDEWQAGQPVGEGRKNAAYQLNELYRQIADNRATRSWCEITLAEKCLARLDQLQNLEELPTAQEDINLYIKEFKKEKETELSSLVKR